MVSGLDLARVGARVCINLVLDLRAFARCGEDSPFRCEDTTVATEICFTHQSWAFVFSGVERRCDVSSLISSAAAFLADHDAGRWG